MAKGKRPAFQFYPADWLTDLALRSCSVAARGLWIDMLCLMHDGRPYGHLTVGKKILVEADVVRIAGVSVEAIEPLLAELEGAEVFSRKPSGVIFSRRMVRDEAIRSRRASGGKLGGNPALVNLPREDKVNFEPTPSSSSSSSSSESYDSGGKPPGDDLTKQLFDALVPILTAAGSKPSSARSLVGRLRNHHGDEKALALVPAASRKTDPAGWLAATLRNPAELPYVPMGRK